MPVEPSEVRVDWCFVTARNQVRRVIEVTSDKVRYVARGRHSDHPWGPRTTVSLDRFCRDVNHRVRCDWDVRYTNEPPKD